METMISEGEGFLCSRAHCFGLTGRGNQWCETFPFPWSQCKNAMNEISKQSMLIGHIDYFVLVQGHYWCDGQRCGRQSQIVPKLSYFSTDQVKGKSLQQRPQMGRGNSKCAGVSWLEDNPQKNETPTHALMSSCIWYRDARCDIASSCHPSCRWNEVELALSIHRRCDKIL